ncbi:MAG: phage tail protein [Ruminococcus flavefaciens]|nr:phage tail protein [Ruminococcus flavefaciens]
MPQPFGKAIITKKGLELMTRVSAGEGTLMYTYIAVGDGEYSEKEKEAGVLIERQGLKSQKNTYAISSINVYKGNKVKMTSLITNQDPITGETLVTEGYFINEMGLFAKIKDTEELPVLCSISVIGAEQGDYMPAYNGHSPARITQDYYMAMTIDGTLNVTIDGSAGAVALAKDVEQMRNELEKAIAECASRAEGITQDNYDALTDDEKMDGQVRYVEAAGGVKAVLNGCEVIDTYVREIARDKVSKSQISNSAAVTESGMMVVDVLQLNAGVSGTLANRLDLLQTKVAELENVLGTMKNRVTELESGKKVVVSSTQPSDTTVIWIKPS